MTIRKTCFWLVGLLLVAVLAGGGYAYWFLTHSDELIRATMLSKIRETTPGWETTLREARLDIWGHVRISDLSLKQEDEGKPAILLPETVIVLDRGKLADQKIVVQQIRLLRPNVRLLRDRAGRWNVEGFKLPEKPMIPPPDLFVEQGTVTIQMMTPEGALMPPLVIEDLNLQLRSDGRLRYRFDETQFQFARSALVEIDGEVDLNTKTWELLGTVQQIKIGSKLLNEVASFFPDEVAAITEKSEQLLAKLQKTGKPATETQILKMPADAQPNRLQSVRASVDRLQKIIKLTADADVEFRVKQWRPEAAPQFSANVKLSEGRLHSAALPFELHNLSSELFVDNSQLLLKGLRARNGQTRLSVNGKLLTGQSGGKGRFDVAVNDLPLSPRLRERLPQTWHKFYDDIKPAGTISVQASLTNTESGKWTPKSVVTVKNCSATHRKFDYRLDHINGTVVQEGSQLTAQLKGLAGRRVVQLSATVNHPGPEAESTVDIYVKRLPIDEKLLAACNESARKALTLLKLSGEFDAHVHLYRPPGRGNKHRPHLTGRLHHCTATYAHFPYELKNLTGLLDWDSQTWTFEDLSATHEAAVITGSGFYKKQEDSGLLDLELFAEDAEFEDGNLYRALPPSMKTVVGEFSPRGRFNLHSHIGWTPGSPPVVDILDLELKNSSIKLRSFPFPFDGVNGHLQVMTDRETNDRLITIHHLKAKHDDEKHIELSGGGFYSPRGEWHIAFAPLTVDDLDTGPRFRRTLPNGVREFFEVTDPRGKSISATGRLSLRGTPMADRQLSVTAAWDIDIIHSGTTITAGVDLKNLFGKVNLKGEWNGESVTGSGWIDLNSVTINGYQLTDVSGPLRILPNQFVIGSREVASGERPTDGAEAPADNERVTAKFIDGKMTLDGIATLDRESGYFVKVQFRNGRLERYAQLYAPRQKQLRGIVNGDVSFDGRGSRPESFRGKGQITISPAKLYELPRFLALTKTLSFLPPEKTAFDRAKINFVLNNREFYFPQIDLVGDAISLRGRGRVLMANKRMNLEFYSTAPRNQLPVPIVGPALANLGKGWIRVHVTGTTDDPRIDDKLVPTLEPAVRGFLGIITPPPPARSTRGRVQPRR